MDSEEKKKPIKIVTIDEVPDAHPTWLMYPLFPSNMVSMVAGTPGCGKSSFLIDIAARISRGDLLPNGGRQPKPLHTLYCCREAGGLGQIKEMYKNAKGDPAYFHVFEDSATDFTVCDQEFEDIIKENNIDILILDPITNFIENDIRNHRAVTLELTHLSELADKHSCTIIIVNHFTKQGAKEKQYSSHGSVAFSAVCRSVIHVYKANPDSSVSYIDLVTHNLAPASEKIAFEITNPGEIRWIGPVTKQEIEQLSEDCFSQRGPKEQAAMNKLEDLLAVSGPMHSIVIQEKMAAAGYKPGTIARAKASLGVKCKRPSGCKNWYWFLPEQLLDYSQLEKIYEYEAGQAS